MFPLHLIALGADPFLLGVFAASAAAAGAPGAFLFGRIADRTGRKRALVIGSLSVITLALALVPLTGSMTFAIGANVFVWFSFAAVGPAVLRARRLPLQGASFPFTPSRVFGWSMRRFSPQVLLDRVSLELVVYYGAVLLFFLGFTAFFAPLPFYLDGLGFGSGAIFWLYLVSS